VKYQNCLTKEGTQFALHSIWNDVWKHITFLRTVTLSHSKAACILHYSRKLFLKAITVIDIEIGIDCGGIQVTPTSNPFVGLKPLKLLKYVIKYQLQRKVTQCL
jgi:hypothetical protein